MSKKVKILLSVAIVGIVTFASLILFISSKINPELIRKKTISAIEESLPKAKAEIGEIDYSLGASISLNVKNFSLKIKKTGELLTNLKEFEVKIPVFSILTGGGVIDIVANSPSVYVVQKGEYLNWSEINSVQKKEIKVED